jgi:hypothetical protein
MQATLNNDIVIALGRGSVTIPDDYPRDVGWERLRWDGKQIVDLATLTGMWVEFSNGMFILHCIELPNTTYLDMDYSQRKNLYFDGAVKLKTQAQIDSELIAKQTNAISYFLESKIITAGNMAELFMVLTGIVALTAIYARTGNAMSGAALTSLIPKLQSLPLTKIAPLVPGVADTLAEIFNLYFSKLEGVK